MTPRWPDFGCAKNFLVDWLKASEKRAFDFLLCIFGKKHRNQVIQAVTCLIP